MEAVALDEVTEALDGLVDGEKLSIIGAVFLLRWVMFLFSRIRQLASSIHPRVAVRLRRLQCSMRLL